MDRVPHDGESFGTVGFATEPLVGYRTDELEDCEGCTGKTFPGHFCDGQ